MHTEPSALPANLDAEQSVLGAILLRPSLLSACIHAGLKPEHFSLSANSEIYATLIRMNDEGQPIDSLLLCEEIDVARVGGDAYIASLTENVILMEAHVIERCRLLQRKAALRKIIAIAESMDTGARLRGADPQEIIVKAMEELNAIAPIEVIA